MSDISYRMHQNAFSFDKVDETVDEIPTILQVETPQVWEDSVTDAIESTLKDVSFDTLNRDGLRTMREHTYVGYTFERPNVKVRVAGVYETQTEELQYTSIKIVLGEYPENSVVDIHIHPDSHAEFETVSPASE